MPAVGANLHDHFNTYGAYRLSQAVTLNDLARSLPGGWSRACNTRSAGAG